MVLGVREGSGGAKEEGKISNLCPTKLVSGEKRRASEIRLMVAQQKDPASFCIRGKFREGESSVVSASEGGKKDQLLEGGGRRRASRLTSGFFEALSSFPFPK